MKITALVENTTNNLSLGTQHGLSFYIEAAGRKILFDMGADDLFFRNAEKLGVDIEFPVIADDRGETAQKLGMPSSCSRPYPFVSS